MVTISLTYLNSEFYFTTNLFKIQDAISNPRITLNGNPQKPSNTKVKNTEIGKKDKKSSKISYNIILNSNPTIISNKVTYFYT